MVRRLRCLCRFGRPGAVTGNDSALLGEVHTGHAVLDEGLPSPRMGGVDRVVLREGGGRVDGLPCPALGPVPQRVGVWKGVTGCT